MRGIGEIDHPSIKDAEELNVFLFRDDCFRVVRRDKFPTIKCLLCPKKYNKTNNISVPCKFKTNSWSKFKAHIQRSEQIYGELVAYPINYKRLPDISIYHKIRLYGNISEFQTNDKFYLFDLKQKRFIHVKRQSLRQMYFSNNYCNYCLCGKSVISICTFISHLSTLESTYHCFLILDDLEDNDEKNQRRIDVLVRDFEKRQLKSSRIRANTNLEKLKASKGSVKKTKEVRNELNDDDESSIEIDESKLEQIERISNDASFTGGDRLVYGSRQIKTCSNEDKSLVIKQADQQIAPYVPRNPLVLQMESTIQRNYDEMHHMIQQLQSDTCRPNLNLLDSLIQEQASLLLVKRVENFQTQDHHLSFAKQIALTANDLNNLLTKYEISNRLRVDKAEICLSLVMKDQSGLNIDQSPPSINFNAIGYLTNGGYDSSTALDSTSRTNQNSNTQSLYYDAPGLYRYNVSNGHNASHSSAVAATNSNDSTALAHPTATSHKSDSNRVNCSAPVSLAVEKVKPHKPPPYSVVLKSELDQSLSYLLKPKLLNFKIPKKPQIASFGHFSSSPDNHDSDRSNRKSHNSSYKSSSSYYGRY